jgi:hypothetical protein
MIDGVTGVTLRIDDGPVVAYRVDPRRPGVGAQRKQARVPRPARAPA